MEAVVITGLGVVGPGVSTLDALWTAIVTERALIGRLARVTTAGLAVNVAAELDDDAWTPHVSPRQRRTLPRATLVALVASDLARRDAGLDLDAVAPSRRGVTLGTALGGWADGEALFETLASRGVRRVNPFIATTSPPFSCAAAVATALGAEGPQTTFTTGCPAAVQAIGHAAMLIATGELDVCVTGGVECPLTPLVLAGMSRTGDLALEVSDPARASRPFDRAHAGMVLAEGAVVLVLESARHAAGRGRVPLAVVAGTSTSCDARGLQRVDEDGAAAARALTALLARSDTAATDLDWVCAHANSAPAFDRKETATLRRALGSGLDAVPVSSIKGVLGHPLGASGAFQAAAAVAAMRHGLVPPTANLDDPDPACALDHVRGTPRTRAVRNVLVTSYGYGGVNGFLLLRSR